MCELIIKNELFLFSTLSKKNEKNYIFNKTIYLEKTRKI